MRSSSLLAALLALSVLACGAPEEIQAEGPPVNALCPGMGGEVKDFGGTTVWKGHVIGFCCPPCKPEFEAKSDEDKAAALAEVGVELD